MTTLVVQTAFLGDVVLTTPLLAALAERHGPVDVVTTPGAAPLLAGHPAVGRIVVYDKRGADRGVGGLAALARRLRRHHYARVYLPHRSWRSAALALLAGIPERIGFADAAAAATYTRRVPRAGGVHETTRLLALAGAVAAPPASGRAPGTGASAVAVAARVRNPRAVRDAAAAAVTAPRRRAAGDAVAFAAAQPPVRLAPPTDAREAADRWLQTSGVPDRFTVLAPGSIWGTKQWPGFPALAALLDGALVVVGSAADRPLAEAIAAAAPGRTWTAAGALSLPASAALLQRATVVVTNDSAPLHLAAAAAVPTVAIFGPTVPEFGFGPVGAGDGVVELTGLPCRPCSRHGPQVCPLGHHRCMRDIAPEFVRDTVDQVIRQREERRAFRTGH